MNDGQVISQIKAPDSRFDGINALITGGARNIGLAIAKELGAKGADVAIADICHDLDSIPYKLSSARDLENAVEELSALGVRVSGFICDVRDEAQVKETVESIIGEFGHLDILVNNAGVASFYPVESLSERYWDEVVDVCLKGTYLCCKQVLPHMIERRYGKIVNISSVAGLRGLEHAMHYCAAKHGVIGLTKALAMEVAGYEINVNAVCPGTVKSPILEGLASQMGLEEEPYAHFSQGHLLRHRPISPQDIAKAVCWLVSDESQSLTGAIINVDAGWMARG